jgi:hypothetical protein
MAGTPADKAMLRPVAKLRFQQIDLVGTPEVREIIACQAQTGMVDSLWCYVEDDRWTAVTTDTDYRHYQACLNILRGLVASESWRRLSRDVGQFVDLGVGTGEKILQFALAAVEITSRASLQIVGLDVCEPLLQSFRSRFLQMRETPKDGCSVISARASFNQLPDVKAHPAVASTRGNKRFIVSWATPLGI